MLQRIVTLLSIFILASFALALEKPKGKEELKIGDPAPKFTLKDADDKDYSLELLLSKEDGSVDAVILIMGDRSARKQGDEWAIELDKLYGKRKEIVILMVADLRGLPFFVTEGMVKWGVKREKIPVPILLDWGGKVNQLYKTQKGKPDLFVIDSDGKVSYHQVGSYSDELVEKVKVKVQDSFKEKKEEQSSSADGQ
jgi:hypothetical protein